MEIGLMSKADVGCDLEDSLRSKDRVFVLFYASWCPYSRRFVPIFEKFAQDKTRTCMSVVVDDKASLCEKYSIEVYPQCLSLKEGRSCDDWTGCSELDSAKNNS
jgi:thioredoxin-like negative regulator of GroEL